MRIYLLRVADTQSNRNHIHWKTHIGYWVYWRKEDHEALGFASPAGWDAARDVHFAYIFSSRREAEAAKKKFGVPVTILEFNSED